MSNLFKKYETSKKLTSEGAPLVVATNEDGTKATLYIARSDNSNQRYAKAIKEVFTQDIVDKLPTMGEEEILQLNIEAFVKASMVTWLNIHDREGDIVPFTEENAISLFAELPELFTEVSRFASNLANYLKANEEKAVKN